MAIARSVEPPVVPEPTGQVNVVLVGAGFAGLEAAKQFAREPGVHLTIIDRRNYHLFQPLLYQVATATLEPANIAPAIRAQFRRAPNIEVHLADVRGIDVDGRLVELGSASIAYDYLIVACGASHSYFGHDEWEPYAPGLKSVDQALEVRRRILIAFERAENELAITGAAACLTFVVVGGGPTGVELAGAIADIRSKVLTHDFRRIDPRRARIVLCESGPRILPAFEERMSASAARELAQIGVEVMTKMHVDKVDSDGVIANGQRIASKTVLWAAGVAPSPLGKQLGVPLDHTGRVRVAPDLSLPGHPEVFVAGDLARVDLPSGPAPGLAAVAVQEGRAAARNVLASVRGEARTPFRYHDKGMLATIGKHRAVAQLRHVRVAGYLAWWLWLFVHVFLLIGFRNRIVVFREWIWSYMFSKRGARVIESGNWHSDA